MRGVESAELSGNFQLLTPSYDFCLVCEAGVTSLLCRYAHLPLYSPFGFASRCSLPEGAPSRRTRALPSSAIGFTDSMAPIHSQSIH